MPVVPRQARRRVLLALALVLGLSALLAALVPSDRDQSGSDRPAPAETSPREAGGGAQSLTFDAARPRSRSVTAGTRVSLEVRVPDAGQVTVAGLGLNAPAEPGTPAAFDVLAEDAGRYELSFSPIAGAARPAGTLVVSESR
jgi:spore germination cell wall hydrolase CwlJ-like protein